MRADELAAHREGCTTRHRFVGAAEINREDVDAVREREVTDERLELLDLARRAPRSLGEDEHRLAFFEDARSLAAGSRARRPCGRSP